VGAAPEEEIGGAPAAVVLRCGGDRAAVREEERGEVRDEEEVALPFYSPEGEGEEARLRRWRSSVAAGAINGVRVWWRLGAGRFGRGRGGDGGE
jgi:hypothetical protein